MRFSAAFGLNKNQSQLDFVDIDVSRDFPLYIDPATFLSREDLFSVDCSMDISHFFEEIFKAIKQKKYHIGLKLLAGLKEPNETFLGVSKGKPRGRGVGKKQAEAILRSLMSSKAAQTGLLTDLTDCALFVPGIGPDKISDITTNIIRMHLIKYTQEQCKVHGIELYGDVPSGIFWDYSAGKWNKGEYVKLPQVGDQNVILVPKRFVKWPGSMQSLSNKYYTHFVQNFIRDEELRTNGSLVQVAKRKDKSERRYVTKKDIAEKYPKSKSFLVEFSEQHPTIYKNFKSALEITNPISDREFIAKYGESFSTNDFGDILIKRLSEIKPGRENASAYHRFIIGVLSYIFYPDFVYPVLEWPIHDCRKKIDIKFTNAADKGFFRRQFIDTRICAREIIVECKNYFDDPKNPEIDQLSGRFSPTRGRLGLLIFRTDANFDVVLKRCRDTAIDDRGFILPFCDKDIVQMIEFSKRHDGRSLDLFLANRFSKLTN